MVNRRAELYTLLLLSLRARGFSLVSPSPTTVQRRAGALRAQVDVDAVNVEVLNQTESNYLREPPPYPQGLHEAAKADRSGPFWASLGEPDATTGVRPPYLRRDDWHVSSTFSDEQRSAAVEEEDAYCRTIVVETPLEVAAEVDEESYDELANRDYMRLEDEIADGVAKTSKFPMPQSWQEYQGLQGQLAKYATNPDLTPKERTNAAEHQGNLANFYAEFKLILSEGWKLLNNVLIEDAVSFVAKMTKKYKSPAFAPADVHTEGSY